MRTIRKEISTDLLESMMQRDMKSALNTIEKFQQDLAQNPANAFSWAANAFADAAQLELCQAVMHYIEGGHKAQVILWWLEKEVQRAAECPGRSTSVPSNLMDTERLVAKAKLLDRLAQFESLPE
jgi:hypothetical protein